MVVVVLVETVVILAVVILVVIVLAVVGLFVVEVVVEVKLVVPVDWVVIVVTEVIWFFDVVEVKVVWELNVVILASVVVWVWVVATVVWLLIRLVVAGVNDVVNFIVVKVWLVVLIKLGWEVTLVEVVSVVIGLVFVLSNKVVSNDDWKNIEVEEILFVNDEEIDDWSNGIDCVDAKVWLFKYIVVCLLVSSNDMLVVFGIEIVSMPDVKVGIVDDKKIVCSWDELNFSGKVVMFSKEDTVVNEEIKGSVVEKDSVNGIPEVAIEKLDALKVFEPVVSTVVEIIVLSEELYVIESLVVNSDDKVDEKNTASVLLLNLVVSCCIILVGNSVSTTGEVDENKSKLVVSNDDAVDVSAKNDVVDNGNDVCSKSVDSVVDNNKLAFDVKDDSNAVVNILVKIFSVEVDKLKVENGVDDKLTEVVSIVLDIVTVSEITVELNVNVPGKILVVDALIKPVVDSNGKEDDSLLCGSSVLNKVDDSSFGLLVALNDSVVKKDEISVNELEVSLLLKVENIDVWKDVCNSIVVDSLLTLNKVVSGKVMDWVEKSEYFVDPWELVKDSVVNKVVDSEITELKDSVWAEDILFVCKINVDVVVMKSVEDSLDTIWVVDSIVLVWVDIVLAINSFVVSEIIVEDSVWDGKEIVVSNDNGFVVCRCSLIVTDVAAVILVEVNSSEKVVDGSVVSIKVDTCSVEVNIESVVTVLVSAWRLVELLVSNKAVDSITLFVVGCWFMVDIVDDKPIVVSILDAIVIVGSWEVDSVVVILVSFAIVIDSLVNSGL